MNCRTAVTALCAKLGITRQNYYKERVRRLRREVDGRHGEELVRAERRIQPRLGGRKRLHLLAPQLAEDGIKRGRDKFFGVLRECGLLLERLPSFKPVATNFPAQSARVP
jgi:hypothetical protein